MGSTQIPIPYTLENVALDPWIQNTESQYYHHSLFVICNLHCRSMHSVLNDPHLLPWSIFITRTRWAQPNSPNSYSLHFEKCSCWHLVPNTESQNYHHSLFGICNLHCRSTLYVLNVYLFWWNYMKLNVLLFNTMQALRSSANSNYGCDNLLLFFSCH